MSESWQSESSDSWKDGPEFETPPCPTGEFLVNGKRVTVTGPKKIRIQANSDKEAAVIYRYLKREFFPIDPDCV